MGSDVNTMLAICIEYKLSVLRREVVETLLNDVVAVEILNELHNIVLKSTDDQLSLAWCVDELDHSLQGASAMLVERNLGHGRDGILDKDSALLVVGILEKTLAKVVAERIDHELGEVIFDFFEDDLNLLLVTLLKLALQEATAVLIFAEPVDLSSNIWDARRIESLISLSFALLVRAVEARSTAQDLTVLMVVGEVVEAALLILRDRM